MQYYTEITLIPDEEVSLNFIWSKLYTQLHIALATVKDLNNQVNIGVSFPQYIYQLKDADKIFRISLGKKLRVFAATEAILKELNLTKWFERISDYVHMTSIKAVPENIKGYSIYKRVQVKSNAERLARHRVKRGDIGYDEALARYRNVIMITDLPYIHMLSLSTSKDGDQKHFKLFIEKQKAEKSEQQVFSTYGLSSVSTVPEF